MLQTLGLCVYMEQRRMITSGDAYQETAGTAQTPWQQALVWTPDAAAAEAASAPEFATWVSHPAYTTAG